MDRCGNPAGVACSGTRLYTASGGVWKIGLPKAGWWGICALKVGPDKIHEGKPLSQDAVLWVEARDVNEFTTLTVSGN